MYAPYETVGAPQAASLLKSLTLTAQSPPSSSETRLTRNVQGFVV